MSRVELLKEVLRHHRTLVVLAGGLMILNGLFYLVLQQVVVPAVDQREQTFMHKQTETRQLLRRAGGYVDTPGQQLVKARRDIAEFRSVVPEHRDFTALIDELLVLAYRAGLQIDQISYSQEPLRQLDLLQYELAFTVTGQYAQLKQLIHALEQSPRIMGIRQISLNSKVEEGATRVALRLLLETFFTDEAQQS